MYIDSVRDVRSDDKNFKINVDYVASLAVEILGILGHAGDKAEHHDKFTVELEQISSLASYSVEVYPQVPFGKDFSLVDMFNKIDTANLRTNWRYSRTHPFDSTDDKIIDKFSSSISRLVIWRGGPLNLHRFSKLRSLKLALPSIEQCNEIQASLTLEMEEDNLASSSFNLAFSSIMLA